MRLLENGMRSAGDDRGNIGCLVFEESNVSALWFCMAEETRIDRSRRSNVSVSLLGEWRWIEVSMGERGERLTDDGMQLCHVNDKPHEIHACQSDDHRRSDEPTMTSHSVKKEKSFLSIFGAVELEMNPIGVLTPGLDLSALSPKQHCLRPRR